MTDKKLESCNHITKLRSSMKTVILIAACLMLSGCGLLGSSNFGKHTDARVQFKQSDDTRISKQAEAIAEIATSPAQTSEGAAYQKAIGMFTIGLIRSQEYNEAPPMTEEQAIVEGVKVVAPFATMGISNTIIATKAIKAAGDVTIGAGSNVHGSLNNTTATALGSTATATATGTAEPTVVDPVIVEPVIVQ